MSDRESPPTPAEIIRHLDRMIEQRQRSGDASEFLGTSHQSRAFLSPSGKTHLIAQLAHHARLQREAHERGAESDSE